MMTNSEFDDIKYWCIRPIASNKRERPKPTKMTTPPPAEPQEWPAAQLPPAGGRGGGEEERWRVGVRESPGPQQ